MKTLPILPLKESYVIYIRAEINRLLMEVLYKPLMKTSAITIREVRNAASDPLIDAINAGRVWYADHEYFGKFNAAVSRQLTAMGAKFNKNSKTWKTDQAPPAGVSIAQAGADARYNALRTSILQTLDDIDIESINQLSDIPDRYYETINWMNDDFQKSVQAITIPPKLTQAQRGTLAAEWGQNLDMYVKKFTSEQVLALRQQIQTNAFAGNRAANLVGAIQHSYDVSRNKAEFLARQETSMLMSKFREIRYRDIGANEYKWRGAMDSRERHDHKILENKIFQWDQPPVVDQKTGRRANPGADYGCRCVAVAIIR